MTPSTQTETKPANVPHSNPMVIRGDKCELHVNRSLLPAPTVVENPQWPWANWQVKYQRDALRKALERCLEAVANLEYVEQTVAGRSGEAEAKRAAKSLARLQEQVEKQRERLAVAQSQLAKVNGAPKAS